jgi:hypothetical protein
MTEATTDIEPSLHPSDILVSLLVTLLAPTFLGVGGDVGLARLAAIETLSAYRARNPADLLAVAQIVAFGLAALGSLSVSLADGIAISMTLRLRGNANACNRSAEQNRRALARSQADNPPPPRQQAVDEPEVRPRVAEPAPSRPPEPFLAAEAEQLLAAESQARLEPVIPRPRTPSANRHQDLWAIAMTKASRDIAATLPNLPPTEREAATMRATLLSSTAHDLTHGPTIPPLQPAALAGMRRADAGGMRPPHQPPPS